MRLQRLTDDGSELFAQAFALYEDAFPYAERRDKSETLRVLQKDQYRFCVLTEEDRFIGIMLFWVIGKTLFLEHFAIRRDLRGKGYGSAALALLKEMDLPIILEMEPPEEDYQIKRYDFYKRNGFVMTPHHHVQAKYHIGDEDLVLKILSYPDPVSREEYGDFYSFLMREVSIK